MNSDELKEYVLIREALGMLPIRVIDCRCNVYKIYNTRWTTIVFPVEIVE